MVMMIVGKKGEIKGFVIASYYDNSNYYHL